MSLDRPQTPPRPIIVVTGANAGLGFAICQRLLAQLSCPSPPDVPPRTNSHGAPPLYPYTPTTNFTLILACRSVERANTARQRLLAFVNAEVLRQRKSPGYNGHAEDFRRGLNIDCLLLDLASMESVFQFAEEALRRYPYVTHLILNAVIFEKEGIDPNILVRQFLFDPVTAVTAPRFNIQPVGSESPDGLGLVWQSNVFGHYCLARLMEPLLLANPYRDSRIEWVSSVDTVAFDPRDPQLRHCQCSYQASKDQIDLISTALSRLATKQNLQEDQAGICHILVQPGVCDTKLASANLGFFMVMAKILSFIWARVLGSRNHPIAPYKGALAPVYLSLAPAAFLQDTSVGPTPKFGTRCTLFGREYIGVDPVLNWKEKAELASDLLKFCENLFQTFVKAHGGTPLIPPSDSGIVCN